VNNTLANADRRAAAVIGGGTAGLTAGYRLRQAGWNVTVYEAANHLGGRVETIVRQGYRADTGATAIAARYPLYMQLVQELGLETVWTSPYLGIYRQGRIRLLRLDRLIRSALATDLLSTSTKIRLFRVAGEVVVAKLRGMLSYDDLSKAAALDDESARDYFVRVAGAEADAYFGEPLTRALLLANSSQVSRVELMSGIANAVAGRLAALVGGQAALIEALARRAGDLRLETTVTRVVDTGSGVTVSCIDSRGILSSQSFDACVVACPLPRAKNICPQYTSELERLDDRLKFTKGINVIIGTARTPSTPAFLVQFPSAEDREIAMIVIENNKAPDRAPAGHGLLTVSWEMAAAAAWADRADEVLVERSLQSVCRLFPELRGTVDFTYVRRWPIALPHTRPGVYRAIAEFAATLSTRARIQFAGDYLSQTGQNTAIAWGGRAAKNLLEAFTATAA